MSYFRTAKLQNKVAPMSYMQYKSMLREGMNGGDSDGMVVTSRRSNTHSGNGKLSDRSGGGGTTFREKYPSFSRQEQQQQKNETPGSGGFRSKPNGLAPLSVTSPRSMRMAKRLSEEQTGNNIFFNNNINSVNGGPSSSSANQTQSNGSLSQRSETWSATSGHRTKKISLPHGSRVPSNIGSPPPTDRPLIGTPRTSRTKKLSTNSTTGMTTKTPPSTAQGGQQDQSVRPASKGSSSGSTTSGGEQKRFSSNSSKGQKQSSSADKTWDRILERIPWSKKRQRGRKGASGGGDQEFQGLQRKDSTKEDNSLGIGKKEVKGCFYKYLDLLAILLPVCMQDGPFFIVRFVLIAHYNVITGMLPILLTKNALVIIVNIYRILILYCSEPPKEQADLDDPSTRVRAAMDTNQKLSNRNSFRSKRASIAVQALTRMQSRLFGQQDTAVLRQTRQTELDLGQYDSPA